MTKSTTPPPKGPPLVRRHLPLLAGLALAAASTACPYYTGIDGELCADGEVENPESGDCEPGTEQDAGPGDAGPDDAGQE